MEFKSQQMELKLQQVEKIIEWASLFNGKVFGGYVRDVIVPRLVSPTANVTFRDIDFWFRTKESVDDFIKALRDNHDIKEVPTTNIVPYTNERKLYHLFRINGEIVQIDIVISEIFPVDDFNVNCLIYDYDNNGPQLSSYSSKYSKDELINNINKKEMTILEGYQDKLMYGSGYSEHHIKRINTRFIANGWSILYKAIIYHYCEPQFYSFNKPIESCLKTELFNKVQKGEGGNSVTENFIRENIKMTSDSQLSIDDIYKYYIIWCKTKNILPETKHETMERFSRFFGILGKGSNWYGFELINKSSVDIKKYQEMLSLFILEELTETVDKECRMSKNELYEHFKSWCKTTNNNVLTEQIFVEQLIRCWGPLKDNCWYGINLVDKFSNDHCSMLKEFIKQKLVQNKDGKLNKSKLYEQYEIWIKSTNSKRLMGKQYFINEMSCILGSTKGDNWFGYKIDKNWGLLIINFVFEFINKYKDYQFDEFTLYNHFGEWCKDNKHKLLDKELFISFISKTIGEVTQNGYWYRFEAINKLKESNHSYSPFAKTSLDELIEIDLQLRSLILNRNEIFYKCINEYKIIDNKFVSEHLIDHPGTNSTVKELNQRK